MFAIALHHQVWSSSASSRAIYGVDSRHATSRGTVERLVVGAAGGAAASARTAGAFRRGAARGIRPRWLVGRRFLRGRAASATWSRIRCVASSRFRSCERSSCATARTTGPSFASTRRRSASLRPADVSTSKSASTRVELFCACWPPGPLDREKRNVSSDRIDSASMAAILLDVDGVLHVSGEPIPGAVDAVRRLRNAGHRLRFVTNSTTMSRHELGERLREMGFAIEDDELQTTGERRLEGARRQARARADDARDPRRPRRAAS